MSEPQVTIVIVPRERFSHSERTLETVYQETTLPFKLIYVSAGTPKPMYHRIAAQAESKGFTLIHTDRFLSPNQARNLGLSEVSTEYLVFLDNDALVTRGWLEALVQCAEETGAWVVGPLYLFGEIERQKIHMAGGILKFTEQQGHRVLYDEQYRFDTPMANLEAPLQRSVWDYAEFHCMLVRTDVFAKLGPLDEKLLSHQEHIDLCLEVQKAGGTVYIEPTAVTSYIPPPASEESDLAYFMLRWSEAWNLRTVQHFNQKWNVTTVRFFTDKTEPEADHTTSRWARGHRRLMTGLNINATGPTDSRSCLEQAQLIIALFLSIDKDRFDLLLTTDAGELVTSEAALDPDQLFERLPAHLQAADNRNLNIMIRPLTNDRPGEPLLIMVDQLDSQAVEAVRPHAFLTLTTNPDRYQCWVAVGAPSWRSAAALRRMVGPDKPRTEDDPFWVNLAGANNVRASGAGPQGRYPRVALAEAVVGRLVTVHQLENSKAAAHLWSGHIA